MDGLAGLDVLADDLDDSLHGVHSAFDELIHASLEVGERLSDCGVEHDHGCRTVGLGSYGAELEPVAGEGEGRGAVAVGIVEEQLRYLGDVEAEGLLAREVEELAVVGILELEQDVAKLLAQEAGDDGWRCLVGSQTVGVAGADDGGLEESVVLVDGHEGLHDEGDEAEIVERSLARSVKLDARIGGQRPVAMLSAAVDAGEGFLVEEASESVLACHSLHQAHEEHIVVYGQVRLLVDGCQLELVGSHLVVARLAGDAQLEGLPLEVLHEHRYTLGDGAEIVVVHLLVLRAVVPHQSAACHQQVRSGCEEAFVDEEILLLPAEIADHFPDIAVEVAAHGCSSLINGLDGLLQGGLVVESLARVGDEDGGDHQRVVDNENGACGVPSAVATSLERAADSAAGERAGIGFLLDELLAREFLHHTAFPVVLNEAVVLLGGSLRQRLEPVGAVGCAQLHRPGLHPFGYRIGRLHVEGGAVIDDVAHLLVYFRWEILEHLLAGEYVFRKELAGAFCAVGNHDGLLGESLSYNLKSKRT